jgi:hypothetical protein
MENSSRKLGIRKSKMETGNWKLENGNWKIKIRKWGAVAFLPFAL